MTRMLRPAVCLSLLGIWAAGPAAGQARLWEAPGPCDRDCLKGIADQYVAAMVAHDPAAAPLADDIRFTENTELLDVGEGLWASTKSASETFRIYVPDPVARQIGFMTVLETDDGSAQLAVRLKVDDGKINEAEHYVARNLRDASLENLKTPRPSLVTELPRKERIPRELMLIIAASYYDAILQSSAGATLFADDCERRENGMITAGGEGPGFGGQPRPSCAENMNSRGLSYITGIDLQRVWIADEVTGLVFALSQFRHAFETNEIQVYDADGNVVTRQMDYQPFDFPAVHITKISDYRIHEQEAMGYTLPYRSVNGWNPFWR